MVSPLWLVAVVAAAMLALSVSATELSVTSYQRRHLTSSICAMTPNMTLPNSCPQQQLPREIMFIVDASNTIDPVRFYGEMLDFLQEIYCALHVEAGNRGSLITFGGAVQVRIPLAPYTPQEWFDRVEQVREDRSVCCSCCTPLAEALRLARNVFTANPAQGEFFPARLAVVITDGAVWQNTGRRVPGFWTWPGVSHAKYKYQIVPTEAALLKNLDPNRPVRLMVLGVPGGNGTVFSRMDYFLGTGIGTRTVICEKRRKERNCVVASSPPFPIISMPISKNSFSYQSWNITRMLEVTAPDLCEIIATDSPVVTNVPTPFPTALPSASPTVVTLRPTASPTQNELFSSLDMYIFVDRSRSMIWRADTCRRAPGGNLAADDEHVCWELFLRFTKSLVTESRDLSYIGHSQFGWYDDWNNSTRGIRVWIYGFACANEQSTPIVERIGERITNQAGFDAAIERAKSLTPDGGTCPAAALERSLGMIMANDLVERPYKVGIMMTDGVWYDPGKSTRVSRGFASLGVLTYALGIAVADDGENYGLSPKEINLQRSQLLAFANGDPSRVKNFGEEGLFILDDIAQEIIQRLPEDVAKNFPYVLKKPYFCGFTNSERCLNTVPETFESAKYCKWIPNNWDKFHGRGRCIDQIWCDWSTKTLCQKDRYCKFSGGKCSLNPSKVNTTLLLPHRRG